MNETEFNEKCAKFLGLKKESRYFNQKTGNLIKKENHNCEVFLALYYVRNGKAIYELQFSKDWNWLQEVKAKICSLKIVDEFEVKYDSVAKGFYAHIFPAYKDSFEYFTTGILAIGTDAYPTEMEATTDIINQFLTWYETHV